MYADKFSRLLNMIGYYLLWKPLIVFHLFRIYKIKVLKRLLANNSQKKIKMRLLFAGIFIFTEMW